MFRLTNLLNGRITVAEWIHNSKSVIVIISIKWIHNSKSVIVIISIKVDSALISEIIKYVNI